MWLWEGQGQGSGEYFLFLVQEGIKMLGFNEFISKMAII